jgi:glyceraldehyde-3-phosphate dehydrogenase (NADP+)
MEQFNLSLTGGDARKSNLSKVFALAEDVPVEHRLGGQVNQACYLVGGELRHWPGPMQPVKSPIFLRTEHGLEPVTIGAYPLLSAKESLEALDAAVTAYGRGRGAWPTMSVEDRCNCLQLFADRMCQVRDEVVNLLMWEIGKTLNDSRKEFDRTIKYIHDTIEATLALNQDSTKLIEAEGVIGQIRRAPLGVVLCMGPFNYPLNETFTTLIPALIMGNTVVMKPPKLGVLLLNPLLNIFQEVFPPGVINIVYGEGQAVIGPLLTSGKIDVLAFIGSSKVADILKKQSPNPHRLRGVLGLEAKNPAVILPDADLRTAVQACLAGSLGFNGQRCTALKIIFVHRSLAKEFTAAFAQAVQGLRLGMPWVDGVSITPLPEENKTQAMNELLDDALAQGAKILNSWGGESVESLMIPAVVYPVKPGMRLYEEEQFGPIVPIVPFDEVEEVLAYVCQSKYGQQISLFSQEELVLAAMIDQLANQVCRINLNCQCQRGPDIFPFTGRKDSAEGTLSVADALRAFSIRSLVATSAKPGSRQLVMNIRLTGVSQFLSE